MPSHIPQPYYCICIIYVATCHYGSISYGQQDFHSGFKAVISETTGVSLITSSQKFIEYYNKVRLTSKYSFNFYILGGGGAVTTSNICTQSVCYSVCNSVSLLSYHLFICLLVSNLSHLSVFYSPTLLIIIILIY